MNRTKTPLAGRLKEGVVKKFVAPLVRSLPKSAKLYVASHALKEEVREVRDLRLYRDVLAEIYLRGEGLEIGALDNPLPAPKGAKVRYVDYVPVEKLRETYPQLENVTPPDIITDGERLTGVADSSQDFVIANHFLEHCADPIGTIGHFLRVLRMGGVLFLTLPDKRFTFDVDRPVTTFEHMLGDYEDGGEGSRRAHFEEAHRVILNITDREEIERDMREVGHTHYHVWSQSEMLTFVAALKTRLNFDFEVEAYASDTERGEGVFILRKGGAGADRALAEASLAQARASYRARYGGPAADD